METLYTHHTGLQGRPAIRFGKPSGQCSTRRWFWAWPGSAWHKIMFGLMVHWIALQWFIWKKSAFNFRFSRYITLSDSHWPALPLSNMSPSPSKLLLTPCSRAHSRGSHAPCVWYCGQLLLLSMCSQHLCRFIKSAERHDKLRPSRSMQHCSQRASDLQVPPPRHMKHSPPSQAWRRAVTITKPM